MDRPRSLLLLLAVLLAGANGVGAQVAPVPLDSALRAKARASCGPLADDSVAFGLTPGSVVFERLSGLRTPALLTFGMPVFPSRFLRGGVDATIVVSFIVDTSGAVEPGSIRVVATSHEDLLPPVERFLRQARFSAGALYGRPVRVCATMPITIRARR